MNDCSSRTGSHFAILIVLILLSIFAAPVVAHDHVTCSDQDITPLGESVSGESRLCFLPHGLRGSMKASGLTDGSAYTLWIVYIDDPSACDPATLDCFDDEDPEGVFGRFDSTVAPENGKFTFIGRVGGMVPSSGSLFFLLLYTHGPAEMTDGRKLARQLLTPEDPTAGAPHLGNVVDGPGFEPAAIAIFAVP